jgi:hypothetical protein
MNAGRQWSLFSVAIGPTFPITRFSWIKIFDHVMWRRLKVTPIKAICHYVNCSYYIEMCKNPVNLCFIRLNVSIFFRNRQYVRNVQENVTSPPQGWVSFRFHYINEFSESHIKKYLGDEIRWIIYTFGKIKCRQFCYMHFSQKIQQFPELTIFYWKT